MKQVLLVFATREGQTGKVARRIADGLASGGARVQLFDAREAVAAADAVFDTFDLLVFGASMHAGGLEPELVDYINANAERIRAMPRSFFLVLLSAATKDPRLRENSLADAREKMNRQLAVGFDDVEMVAGALTYSKYPLPLKWLMKRIAAKAGGDTDTSRDYEYTDWDRVDEYAHRLLRGLSGESST